MMQVQVQMCISAVKGFCVKCKHVNIAGHPCQDAAWQPHHSCGSEELRRLRAALDSEPMFSRLVTEQTLQSLEVPWEVTKSASVEDLHSHMVT